MRSVGQMMSTNQIFRRLAVPVVALGLAVALGACGDDEETEGSSMTSNTTTTNEAAEAADTGTETDKVAIVDFQFKPATVKVATGTTVTWTNEDGFAHTATAEDKSFDTGNLDKGESGTATFEKAGTFKYICTIHNSMVGTVIVT